jgi:hypothetical protein
MMMSGAAKPQGTVNSAEVEAIKKQVSIESLHL